MLLLSLGLCATAAEGQTADNLPDYASLLPQIKAKATVVEPQKGLYGPQATAALRWSILNGMLGDTDWELAIKAHTRSTPIHELAIALRLPL
jgi:hypothetical protein